MKSIRTAFVISVALSGLICLPALGHDEERREVETPTAKGYVLKPGQGEDIFGDRTLILKASPASGTQGAVFIRDRMPAGTTSGIHVHLEADEFFYFITGNGKILVGADEHEVSAGDVVFVPAGSDHRVTSSRESHCFLLIMSHKKVS